MTLQTFGWNDFFAEQIVAIDDESPVVGRVIADYGGYMKVAAPEIGTAEVAGKLKQDLASHELPKVGDWVLLRPRGNEHALIYRVLGRKTAISRRAAGSRVEKQILAANIDIAFVVQALDADFNIARLERYVYQLQQAGIVPRFIFTKSDLTTALSLGEQLNQVDQLGVEYMVTSTVTGRGLAELRSAIPARQTAVLLGSSGVGKSTLTNWLLGEARQKTAARRTSDARGRHTTSYRELFILPEGGLLIDTPGIRELQLWNEGEGSLGFDDIELLARGCEFTNCRHGSEVRCAVRQAIEQGSLAPERLAAYRNLQDEARVTAEQISSADIKAKKQRARRMRKIISSDEALRDAEFYDDDLR